MLKKKGGKDDVYDWLVELTEPIEKQQPTAGATSPTVSAVMFLLGAIGLFLLM